MIYLCRDSDLLKSSALIPYLESTTVASVMSFDAVIILAFGMSMAAFAAAIGKGAALHRPPFKEVLRTGVIFGVIEAITPVIGWDIGPAASQFITNRDQWVAFMLFLVLGSRMIVEGIRKEPDEPEVTQRRSGFWSRPPLLPALMPWL